MREKQPLLSVIVPVYNTEKFLRKCLNSIISQTYKNLEIIVVNDGSAENENEIIKEYIAVDRRIRLIEHEENKGLFQARITGMENAKGEYFAFVDSDDSISMDYCRLLIKKAVETDSDMVISDFANEYEDGRQEYYNLDPIRLQDVNLEGEQVLERFMKQQGLFFGWHTVWNKIYSMDLWEKSKKYLKEFAQEIGHLVMTEDIAFSCVFWSLAEKVTNVHNIYYFYAQHAGQSISAGNFEKFAENANNVAKVFEFFKKVLVRFGNWKKSEKDYEKWRELYIKHWCNNIYKLDEKYIEKSKTLIKNLFAIKKLIKIEKEDNYFYSIKTDFKTELSWFETIKKRIADNEKDYISFDIFDTLILRPLFAPSDLFKFLDFEINKSADLSGYVDFAEIRMNAESSVRKSLNFISPFFEDVTLDEIYDYIKKNYTFDEKLINHMKQREIELELEFCIQRNTGKELYELAQYCGKKIIFISDMYLSAKIINQILSKNGYEGRLFLSSETRLLKRQGNLYKYALSELNISAEQLIHIGDNWAVDIEAAAKLSIESLFLPKPTEQFTGENPGIYSGKSYAKIFDSDNKIYDNSADCLSLGVRCMLGLAANKIFDNPYTPFHINSDFNANPYYIGYYALGMHLYAVANWLINSTKDAGTIHFAMRDGYLPQKAYEILSAGNDGAAKSNFLYFTRKSILNFMFANPSDIYSVTKLVSYQSLSPEMFIENMKNIIKKDRFIDIDNLLEKNNIIYSQRFTDYDSFVSFINFFQKNLLDMKSAKKYINKLTNYAVKNIKENDVYFDLGYSGRNEFLISKIMKKPLNAFYIHTNYDNAYFRCRLAGFNIKTFYDFKPSMCVIIREHLFSKLEASCISFDPESSELEPIFEEYKHNYQTDFVTEIIQNAAIDFVADMKNIFGKYADCIIYKDLCASMPYEHFMNHCGEIDMEIFAASSFEDDMHSGTSHSFVDFWKKQRSERKPNITQAEGQAERIVELKIPIGYEEFLTGKPKWKKAAFMWLFDKKLFNDRLKNRFRKK